MSTSSFGTSLRRDPSQPAELMARIDLQLRERLEEAVDLAGIDTVVQARRAHRRPEPRPDNAADREEYTATVRAFVERLDAELRPALPEALADRANTAVRTAADEMAGSLAVQVLLAKELPDYWQRFEQVRTAYTAERVASGGERRGLLDRLRGRG